MVSEQEPVLYRHPQSRVSVEYVGAERQPVVCIDEFLEGAEALRELAVTQSRFHDNTGFYPGLRMKAPDGYYRALHESLPPLIEGVFGVGEGEVGRVESSYSLVTTPPNALHPMQRIPHFDSNRPTELAMIHFLCGPDQGGTSFYRHRATGYEFVDESRKERFFAALERDAETGQLPPPAYINGDTELFERIASFDGAFNRLLLYRCTSLHSGNIAEDFGFSADPAVGRLSINSFLLNG